MVVLCRRRVEEVDGAVEVDVVNELVKVVEPAVSIVVVEVAAAWPHLVNRLGEHRIARCRLDNLVDPRIDVVVVAPRVILWIGLTGSDVSEEQSEWNRAEQTHASMLF